MTAVDILEKAYQNLDVNLLKTAIDLGADINTCDKRGESMFENMVYDICSFAKDNEYKRNEKELFYFTKALIENGLDLNHVSKDDGETCTTFGAVARWSYNLKYVEFLLQNGMNPNIIYEGDFRSPWDEIDGDIFLEECCGYPDSAKWLYDVSRLSIAYGAKPMSLLQPEWNPIDSKLFEAAMNLDAEKLDAIDAAAITGNRLSHFCTYYSRFIHGHDFYFNPGLYQERLVNALEVIVTKIGIADLDSSCLCDCVEGQLVKALEYLLGKGADPNVNCFSPSYSWVKSSALYELENRGAYYDQDNADAMRRLLLDAGAMIR